METKHTPAPWSILEDAFGDSQIGIISGNVAIAKLTTVDNEANAKLIAAAPELLEALIEVKDFLYKYHNQPSEEMEFLNRVSEAIKKATD